LLQPGTQPAIDYWLGVYGLASQTYGEISRIAERRLAESRFGSAQGAIGASATAKKAA